MNVVVGRTEGKELYRHVGVDIVVTVGGLDGVKVSILTRNAKDVGSIPALGRIFPSFITPMTA